MEISKRLKRFEEFYHILDQWITLYEENISVESILKKHGYKKIAIYGMGTMALHLIQALKQSSVSIEYVIDNKPADYYIDVKVISYKEVNNSIDVIIYTDPNEDLHLIQPYIKNKKCDLISLSDIIFDNL